MNSIVSEVSSVLPKKKCIICENVEAKYCIKGIRKDCYCEKCASEQFSDLGLLEKL